MITVSTDLDPQQYLSCAHRLLRKTISYVTGVEMMQATEMTACPLQLKAWRL